MRISKYIASRLQVASWRSSKSSGAHYEDEQDVCPIDHVNVPAIELREGNQGPLPFRVYALQRGPQLPILPASPDQGWMEGSEAAFANRCLQLRIAKQSGWTIFNPIAFEVIWNGGRHTRDLQIRPLASEVRTPRKAILVGSCQKELYAASLRIS